MGNKCDKITPYDPEQIYSKLRKDCSKDGLLWKDPKFPASNTLLTEDSSDIKWLR